MLNWPKPPSEKLAPLPAPTCACLRRYTRRTVKGDTGSAYTVRTRLGVFLDFFMCCMCWVPVFGELFDEVVRMPTHALTGAERGWRLDADGEYDKEKDGDYYPRLPTPAAVPAAPDAAYASLPCRLLCCCSLREAYKLLVKWVFYPVFRYLLLNVLFEVLAEDEGEGLRHLQEVRRGPPRSAPGAQRAAALG